MTAHASRGMEDANVLIIGGLGFLGSNLAHRLVASGARVTLFDACLDPYGWNYANITEIARDVEVVVADTRNFEAVCVHVADKDLIFNFAAQVSHSLSMERPCTDIEINCRGNMNVLEACRRLNDGVTILFAGTRSETGEAQYLPVDEDHPDNPSDIYSINKLAAEKYHLMYHHVYGMPTTVIRVGNTYGPRHQMKHGQYGVLNYFIRRAMLDEPILIYGDGEQIREYCYVDDVCDAFYRAAQTPKSIGEYFVIGSGEPVKFIEMANRVLRAVGKGSLIHTPYPEGREKIDVQKFFVANDKISEYLGWHPTITLKEGLEKTVAFYQTRLMEYI
ncbi:MAG: NAD-dependent epimerase/dehydratase family protein [Methanomicrobiaceae archaeon]|nr:NAD-dependent epimerase/dehydratase family protein [Methanomicrobiaceae archaeon]